MGRSWRARESSSRIAWLASALVSASSASSSGGAASRTASSRSSRPVSDWLTSSWRSRATRARSSSWARSAADPARRRSASRRSHHAQEGELDPRHLLGLADARRSSGGRVGPGRLRSTCSISSIRLLERREARAAVDGRRLDGEAESPTTGEHDDQRRVATSDASIARAELRGRRPGLGASAQ